MCPHFVSKSRGNEGLKQGKVESFVLGLLRGEEGGGELTASKKCVATICLNSYLQGHPELSRTMLRMF